MIILVAYCIMGSVSVYHVAKFQGSLTLAEAVGLFLIGGLLPGITVINRVFVWADKKKVWVRK